MAVIIYVALHLIVGGMGMFFLIRTLSSFAVLANHYKAFGPAHFHALVKARDNATFLVQDAFRMNLTCLFLLIAVLILL